VTAFSEAWDRERAAWIEGHGGEEHGYAIEGDEGHYLRREWEDAFYDLNEVWTWYSYRLQPPLPITFASLFSVLGGKNGVALFAAMNNCTMSVLLAHGQNVKLLRGGGA
jgi:hypothetical protein